MEHDFVGFRVKDGRFGHGEVQRHLFDIENKGVCTLRGDHAIEDITETLDHTLCEVETVVDSFCNLWFELVKLLLPEVLHYSHIVALNLQLWLQLD